MTINLLNIQTLANMQIRLVMLPGQLSVKLDIYPSK